VTSTDAPDWERVVTTVLATGDVPDAPDWERIVVGSGGAPIGGFANPMTTKGDIIIGGTSGAPARLGLGTSGQVLTVHSGDPAWETPASGGGNIVGLTPYLWTQTAGLGASSTIVCNGGTNEVLADNSQSVVVTYSAGLASGTIVVFNFWAFKYTQESGSVTNLAYLVSDGTKFYTPAPVAIDSAYTFPGYNVSVTWSNTLTEGTTTLGLYAVGNGGGTLGLDNLNDLPAGQFYSAFMFSAYAIT
jgi:hypothetical protein